MTRRETGSRLSRRRFIRELGVSTAAVPFLWGLPSLRGAEPEPRPRRLIIMFSPNGTIPPAFWPDQAGLLASLKPILEPLDPLRARTTVIKGISNRIGGDGDSHMRGMSCLLTGTELFPGNIQGGSHTPAGWAKGISIDQEIRNFLQARDETRTRFGSLEFGVAVPDRADPWTRMCYAGPNQPIPPVDDPRQMLDKLYGARQDKDDLLGIVDHVREDLRRVASKLSAEDRRLLDEHLAHVAAMQRDLAEVEADESQHPVPEVDPHIELVNDNTPKVSRLQIDLLVNSLANDMARVATLQYMRSVGQARMNWLGVEDGHHGLSHEPDDNDSARDKLVRINRWFCGELTCLAQRLAETPEAGGSMLDNTLIVWTNELGKGNSHTLNDIPMVLVGGENLGVQGGRALELENVPHNRMLLALAKAMGHELPTFGLEHLCQGGPLDLA